MGIAGAVAMRVFRGDAVDYSEAAETERSELELDDTGNQSDAPVTATV